MADPPGSLAGSLPRKRGSQNNLSNQKVKYKPYSKDADPLLFAKWTPSQLIADLRQPALHAAGWRPKPQVVELLNMSDQTHQVQSAVSIDEPLFQPEPPEVVFHSYEPFRQYEATLRLRNNDKVARRVTVGQLDSSCFSVQRLFAPGQAEGSKVAAGMEALFRVSFTPDSIDSYEQQLLVTTGREQFLVPLLGVGAAAALDLPDQVTLPPAAAHKTVQQPLLVSNVGRAAGRFQLSTSSSCFAVSPARAVLAPGESLQLQLAFTPDSLGAHQAELQVVYEDSSKATFTALRGTCVALDVGLSDSQLAFLPTYMSKHSQRSFRVFNNSDASVAFSIRAQPFAAAELAATCTVLAALQHVPLPLTGTGSLAGHGGGQAGSCMLQSSSGNARDWQQQQQQQQLDTDGAALAWGQQQQEQAAACSDDGDPAAGDELLLEHGQFAELRRTKRCRRDIAADKQLFSSPFFAVFPAEGVVGPHSQQEVTVQFCPDSAGTLKEVAWVQLQGSAERLPLQLVGEGLGAVVVFSYDALDIGEAFVNTEHCYDVQLLNKGKVDAHWQLQPCNTRFGSKFRFSPVSGLLQPGDSQAVSVKLLSDCLGQFAETFHLQLAGSRSAVPLHLRGEVVGPRYELDRQQLDFGIVSFGFRYTQEVVLANTGAIPLQFSWHAAKESDPADKEFTLVPARGSVLPYAKQLIRVEFQPQSVQRYCLELVMDIPGVTDAAVALPVTAECAVPMITLAEDSQQLQFAEVFLRHAYSRQFTLVNHSKLPAKFEVLEQDQQSQCLGTFTATPAAASIPAKGTCVVSLTLQALRLGRLQLPVSVRVAGSRNKPLSLVVDAKAVGPSLEFAVRPPEPADAAGGLPSGSGEAPASSAAGSTAAAAAAGEAAAGSMPASSSSGVAAALEAAPSSLLVAEASATSRAASITSTVGRNRAATGNRRGANARSVARPLQWGAGAAISWGKVQVLQSHGRELRLRNPTLIDAEVKLFLEGRDSVFQVEPREAVVAARGELCVAVTVLLDDTATFKDVLHVLITDGVDISIPLDAAGVGNTLVSEALSWPQIDFGAQFVGRAWQLEVVVANMGRKPASLTWSNNKLQDLLRMFSKTAKASGKKFVAADLPSDQQPVFSISPEKMLLAPKETTSFLICGLSNKAGLVSEQLQCQAVSSGAASESAGSKPKPVFDVELLAEVVTPLLELSRRAVEFAYTHVRGSAPEIMVQPIQARNVSKLPLQFTLKALPPFRIEPAALSLAQDEAAQLLVSFDPDFRHDLVSQTVKQRCLISYPDNPQKDWLELSGRIEFPNLLLESSSVDFGCVLIDSIRRVSLGLTNPGSVPVEYSWSWVTPAEAPAADAPEGPATSKTVTGKAPKPPPTQLFDILPVQGLLQPGQTEQVEFSFFAYPGVKATAVAACSVADGPVYQVTLAGESNSMKYDVSPQFYDCGLQPYDRAVDRELLINNSGKVAFDFAINLGQLSRPGIIEAAPMAGRVAAGEKAHIKLKIKAGIPARLMELMLVSVAHFEPVQVQVLVEGTYPVLGVNLPRVKDEAFLAAVQQAQQSADDQGLEATTAPSIGPAQTTRLGSIVSRTSNAVASMPRGSTGSGSVAGQSTLLAAAAGATPPGSGAKSQLSGVSGASAARSRASVATAASVGAMLAKDKLSQLQAALPADKRLDIEAERLRLVQQLLSGGGSHANNSRSNSMRSAGGSTAKDRTSNNSRGRNGNSRAAATVVAGSPGAAAAAAVGAEASSAAAAAPHRTPVAPKLPELVSAHYLVDFGSVTKGINKSRKVKLTNMSPQQIAFVVDKQTLESFGFSMVPEAAVKLAGAPECQSCEVTFTLLAAKAWLAARPLELTLPLMIKGGPAVLLTLRALLVVPEVVPSASLLDYGTVSTGHCKVFTVQLHNPRGVPAEWSIKRPAVDSPKLRDWGCFVPEPCEGVLEPGAATSIRVTFTPLLNRDLPYSLALPIRVSNNPKPCELLCSGKGHTPRVELSPSIVDCGAILPRFPGQQPAEATVQLRNLGSWPVEVVCLDLDSQYLADEEALRSLDIYGESGVGLLRPLAPGEPLWPELLELAAQRRQLEAAAEAAMAAAKQVLLQAQAPDTSSSAAPADTPPAAPAAEPPAVPLPAAAAVDEGVGELEATAPPAVAPQQPERLVVLMVGPPMAGNSTQAAMLSSRYGIPCVAVDTLLQEVYALSSSPSPAAPASSGSDGTAGLSPMDPQLLAQLGRLLAPIPPAAAPLQSPRVTGTAPAAAASGALTARKGAAAEQQQPQQQPLTPAEVQDVVVRALRLALQQPQYSAGVIFDGVGSKHLPAAVASARAVLQAVGLQCKTLPVLEPAVEPPRKGSAAAGAGKGKPSPTKGSRPTSSKSNTKAGAALQEPPTPTLELTQPDVWEGTQQVFVVELSLSKDDAARRFAAAVASTAAGLEPAAVGSADRELLVEASFMGQQQQQQPAEQASDQPQDVVPVTAQPANPAFEASWAAYEAAASGLAMVFGPLADSSGKPINHRLVSAVPAEDQVFTAALGISFTAGQVSSVLPAVPVDQLLLPPPYELCALAQPPKRSKRRPLANFKIWTLPGAGEAAAGAAVGLLSEAVSPGGEAAVVGSAPASRSPSPLPAAVDISSRPLSSMSGVSDGGAAVGGKGTPRGKNAAKEAAGSGSRPVSGLAAGTEEDAMIAARGLRACSRWVIPPHGSVSLLVQFASDSVGRVSESLCFDVVCGERNEKVALVAACDYPRISTEPRNMFYKTAKVRPSTPQVKQQFILPTSTFEFGAVLAGRDRSKCLEGGAHPDHVARFRVTNNGLFPLHADFWLKSEGAGPPDPAAPAADSAKKKPAAVVKPGGAAGGKGAAAGAPFLLHPSSMDLAIDKTQELSVFAFPGTEGLCEDVIMCRLRDNPTPLEFPINVIGARPAVSVKLTSPQGNAADGASSKAPAVASQRRASEVGGPKPVKVAGGKSKVAAELTVQFDKLLLNKKDAQSLIISNTGVLPFKWRLAGAATLPAEFKVLPAAGELAARSDARVTVQFSAIKKQDLSELITLEVLDLQEALGISRSIPIAIRGEAYDIHVDLRFPQDSFAGVDFGPLRVVDDCVKTLVLKNTEKYEVRYRFAVRSEAVAARVTITPDAGAVMPGKEVAVQVHWNKDLSLRHEAAFAGNTDILLSLIEPATDNSEQQVPIKLLARAMFSHYAITPARGLHFGPNTFNTLSKPRSFEVVNLGEFPFSLRVFPMPSKQDAAAAAEKAAAEEAATRLQKNNKGCKAAGAATAAPVILPPPPGALQLGQFTLDPAEALVQPGCRQEVSVVFRAEGSTSWSAVAGLDISKRDFADQPQGIPYELGGESCIPGIDASNVGSIFEEHVVLSHLDPFKPINCSFGLRDKVFNFGTVIAQLGDTSEPAPAAAADTGAAAAPGTSGGGGKEKKAAGGARAAASTKGNNTAARVAGAAGATNVAAGGGDPASAGQCSLLDEPGAVKANLKFVNPIKVPCTVNFTIKPRGGHQPGVRFPMEVLPSSIVIPAHEHRHITLVFCPRAIQQFSATFEAAVVDGATDPATAGFVCELRGEGTLPSLCFQEPSAIDSAGRPLLKFGKLLAGRTSTLPINVRSNGLLPATARIEMEPHPAFTLLEGTQVFTVESKKAVTFSVLFSPAEVGSFSHELQLRVRQNPFEQHRVAIMGECYQEDITFAGLPGGALDVVTLPDVCLQPVPAPPSAGTRPASRMSATDGAPVLPAGAMLGPQLSVNSHGISISSTNNSSCIFSLVNNSSTKHFRFKFPDHPQLRFSPSVGHLHAEAVKDVTLVFASNTPVKLDGQEIKMAVSQITYKGEPLDWDDVLALSLIASGARASSATRVATGLPGAGPKPGAEPLVDLVAKTQRDVLLKVFGVADSPRYECSAPVPAIQFRPTMMLQTRSFTFNLTNSAMIAMEYCWEVLDRQGAPDTSGLYTLTPSAGVLSGGATQQVVLRFSPQEVEDVSRTLVCRMPALEHVLAAAATAAAAGTAGSAGGARPASAPPVAAVKPLVREVTGKVLRPWCHFELPDSDYLSAGRRNPEQPGPSGVVEPLDPATKVLEFESLGVRVCNTKRFFVLNPTSISYEFVWAPVLPPALAALGGPPPPSPFGCLARKGIISGGRRHEMVFEFTPSTDVLSESFWSFTIPSQGIAVPFLLVGHVSEPRVSLDRPAINFGQVQLGVRGKLSVALVNDEHLPFSFSLDKASYDASDALLAASGGRPLLDVQPASGTVPPNSKVDLCAVFTPQAERPINYNVVVRVRNKPTPLVLNVKGEGYALSASMLLELPDDGSLELSPSGANTLDFGQVVINDRVVRSFSLVNSGKVNYDFVWRLGPSSLLSVKPQSGSVPKGERRTVELSYAPTAADRLAAYPVSCEVINGPKFELLVSGCGYKPKLHCSFLRHDFGPVNVFQAGMTPASVVLVARNDDQQVIAFDTLFDNSDNWQVESSPCALAPGHSHEISITFRPTAAQSYSSVVPLQVNGLYNINIMLAGEGVPLRIEFVKPELQQRGVAFGAVPCGSSCSRTLGLVNRGRAAAFVSLEPSAKLFERLGIELIPAASVMLRPREVAELTLWYRPKQRLRLFKEPLRALVAGVPQQLTMLSGACTGLSLLLASDSIPFGTVVLGSRTTKRLQLSNQGDVGCRFAWQTQPLKQEFSISPAEGFLAPGQDVKLEVAFHPTAVNSDIRVERLRCRLLAPGDADADGSGTGGTGDLLLTLTGACAATEALGEPVVFKCNVRASTSKSIRLHNPTSSSWQLRPVIQHEFWSGPELLQVPAGGAADYQLTYKPLTMTAADGPPHEGSVFFAIPDGSGLLYKLQGQADQPTPEAVVELSLPAKTPHHQMLHVTNWLHKPQRFQVIKELVGGDGSTRLEGASAIDVPALSQRDYKLQLFAYTQGLTHARVTFKAEGSGEFVFYEVRLTSGAPAPAGRLVLECPVRSQTSGTISIVNPLPVPVALKPSVNSKQVMLSPEAPVLAPGCATSIEVRYRPLLMGSAEAALKLESAELGLYEWRLKLTGAPTNPERSLAFSVPLGTRDTQVFRFTHYLPEKAEYKCSFKGSSGGASSAAAAASGVVSSSSGFDVPASITAPPAGPGGVEVECLVGFEPCALGEAARAVLVVGSATAGAYEVPLVGQCVPPKPCGPVDVSKGSAVVPFRNVFAVEAEFHYSCDNPAFVMARPSEKLAPKKPVSITVSFRPEALTKAATGKDKTGGAAAAAAAAAAAGGGGAAETASAAPPPPAVSRTAKLTITCPKQTSTQWVFYLQA